MTLAQSCTACCVPAPPTSSVEQMSGRARVKLIVILGALTALGPLTVDTYLPALPSITRDLQTTSAAVGLTLTGTLIGFALGQILVGPLSDTFGRRRPLLIGAGLHILASLLCAIAPNIVALSAFRILQGIAASGAAVVALAIVRDVANGRTFVVMMSRLLLVMGAAPVLAPTLGSQLLRWTQWRGVFVTLAGIAALLLVFAAWGLHETLPPSRRLRGGVRGNLTAYGVLLRDRTFVGLALVAGLSMSAIFGYVGGSPFVMQEQYGLNVQQFGLVFGAGSFWLICGTQLNPRLVARWTSARVLGATLAVGATAGGAMVLVADTRFGGLVGLLVPLWVVLGSIGVALPNSPALALNGHGDTAGTAAALLGATQFGVAGLVGPIYGVLGLSAVTMAAIIAGGLALTLAIYVLVVQPWRLEPTTAEAHKLLMEDKR
jgi:DHA1 family bicyclomycin/chloramphenicol resistance-like MFS transporter